MPRIDEKKLTYPYPQPAFQTKRRANLNTDKRRRK